VVAGFLLALEEIIAGATSDEAREHLRLHAAHGLRRGAEKYRLDLLTSVGVAELRELDLGLEEAVQEVRRTYLSVACGATQAQGEA
jgi:hypothetical protein